MLGIKLFKPTPGILPISFKYELRSIEYIELDGEWFIGGGDKSGLLKVFRYNEGKVEPILERKFDYKIISMDFILYGKNEDQLGLIAALDTESKPNLYFNPDIRSQGQTENCWHEIKHEHDKPQMVFQPYVMTDLSKIIFSFQAGYFVIANVFPDGQGSYKLEKQWDHSFPSKIVDACAEFPKNLDRTRKENKGKNNYINLASKVGCILILTIDGTIKLKNSKEKILHNLKTIHNSVRSIIPINKLRGADASLRGILGIAGTEFFCLYRDKEKNAFSQNYKILTERYVNSLYTIDAGSYKIPGEKETNNIILMGDSQGMLYARQFSTDLNLDNFAEVLFDERKIFREKMKDRVFGMVPITGGAHDAENKKALLRLVLGLGSHEIIFEDLKNKDYIIDDIKYRLELDLKKAEQVPLESIVEKCITLARDAECDLQLKNKLIAAIFEHKPKEQSLVLRFLKQGLIDPFIQLVYWLLSSGKRPVFLHLYKKLCDLIQLYYQDAEHGGKDSRIYKDLGDLLIDIDKFWIGGESYSGKTGNISQLIIINEENKKPMDKLIYQACINDRSFTIEHTSKISNYRINSICRYEQVLFVSDSGGNLHLLNPDLSEICNPINIRDYSETIYGKEAPIATNLEDNYIRQVFILPGGQWGFFLLQAGGIWRFPLERILDEYKSIIDSRRNLHFVIPDIIFKSGQSQLMERDIMAYSIKADTKGKLYIGDRFSQLYELKFNHGIPDQIQRIFPEEKSKDHNPIRDFDFLKDDRVVYGDISGNITVFDLNEKKQIQQVSFPTTPRFNVCYTLDKKTAVYGTEEGNIIAFDFSMNPPFCKWSHSLPGPVRFIVKTDDNRLLIGGSCPKILIIDPTGKLEDYIEIDTYTKGQDKYLVSINAILPFYPGNDECYGQRILILAGEQQGHLKIYRIYRSKIFEKEIKEFFYSFHHELNNKVKMRCININESSLRRLYTDYESKDWNLNVIQTEVEKLARSGNYSFHVGPLLHLVPFFFMEFINEYNPPIPDHDFINTYNKFQNTINLLILSWGIKNNSYCQQVMKTLGVHLFKIMVNKPLMEAIDKTIGKSTLPNLRSPRELMEEVRVHCIPITLIIMYEEVVSVLSEIKDNLYLETAVDSICQKLRGREFDKDLPDPLLHKKVEVLAFMVDQMGYCPIKLCYKLFEENADIPIFYHLSHKVSDHRHKKVFDSAHRLGTKLYQFDDISDVLFSINGFKDMFPEKFEEEQDLFYREFSFIFDRAQKILSFSDAMDIVASYRLTGYNEEGKYFSELIRWLNEIIEKVSGMKKIFQDGLTQTRETFIPRYDLVMLRAYFKKLFNKEIESFPMGKIYGYFLKAIIDHLTNILSVFCEVRLPILSLENTATFLDNYLDEIRRKEQPLPALDNPDTLDNYNHFFRNMFNTIIVGMSPRYACFQYPKIENFNPKNHFEIYTHKKKIFEIKSEDEMSSFPDWMDADAPNIEDIFLYLPDSNHEYGKYRFLFLKKDIGHPRFKEKISRFRGFVSVLNLYIMAFNGMTEAEMQSRFSHRLFAHQSKEPLLALRNQLIVLEDKDFFDPDGSVTRDYHERMRGLVEQMLNRCDFILNVRKLFRHAAPELSFFHLESMVNDVVKSMRKVMTGLCYKGEILIEKGQGLDIEISSDESKLREILEQLIRNSIKYCIGTRNIKVEIGYDRKNLHFKVSDNGVGIPEDELPYIFAPYFRGEYGETNNIDGDGLGLWVAKTYADILGGEITAQNKYDSKSRRNGTSFTLIVPREIKEKEKKEEKNEQ
jgi:signal transduction histidine kinase